MKKLKKSSDLFQISKHNTLKCHQVMLTTPPLSVEVVTTQRRLKESLGSVRCLSLKLSTQMPWWGEKKLAVTITPWSNTTPSGPTLPWMLRHLSASLVVTPSMHSHSPVTPTSPPLPLSCFQPLPHPTPLPESYDTTVFRPPAASAASLFPLVEVSVFLSYIFLASCKRSEQ